MHKKMLFIFALCIIFSLFSRTSYAENILDMTYPFSEETIYWPTAESFKLVKEGWKINDNGRWYASNNYSASEHGGTHVDAPIHFVENGRKIDGIKIEEWIAPVIKIDVKNKCIVSRDYLLSVNDIKEWEKKNGKIPEGSWVLMYTGIDETYYPDKKGVLGTDLRGEGALQFLSYPGFSPEVAQLLVTERKIAGIGIDTPSVDYGKSRDFKVHQIICGADKLIIENIANLAKLPTKGAKLYVIPMLIKDGTGAPARVFAVF